MTSVGERIRAALNAYDMSWEMVPAPRDVATLLVCAEAAARWARWRQSGGDARLAAGAKLVQELDRALVEVWEVRG